MIFFSGAAGEAEKLLANGMAAHAPDGAEQQEPRDEHRTAQIGFAMVDSLNGGGAVRE